MEGDLTKVGSFLPVPCVQELAKEGLTTVPPRYVRLHEDPPTLSNVASLPQAPVIDMQKLFCEELKDSELDKFHHACKDWGFLQLINHGVSSSLVEKVKVEIQEFFNLPMEKKKRYWQRPGEMEGFGQAFVVSEEQKLDWGDMFYMITLPTHLRKPYLFPDLPLPLRDTLEAYSKELKGLAWKILNPMAAVLGMEPNDMKKTFEEGRQMMRMNYYPPCPQPELVMGLNSHSDAAGLTILLQVNDVEGLQIKKDGKWVPIKPLPNAFIVNIGDSLEIVTNGIYRSVEHRAKVNKTEKRLSVATFLSAKVDGVLKPAPSLVSPESPAMYHTITVADFFRMFYSRQLNGKSLLDSVRIETNNQDQESG